MRNKENIENNLDKVNGGISEQPITESHKTCKLCGMEVWFTKDMTMEVHQQSNICKMLRK